MAINTGRRVDEKNPPARTPYTTPPTYKEPVKPPLPIGYVPPADNQAAPSGNVQSGPGNPQSTLDVAQAQRSIGPDPLLAAIQNQTQAAQPTGVHPVIGSGDSGVGGLPPAPTTQQPAQPSETDDYIKQYMDQVFGGGRSFDPISDKITGQRDDALRSLAENMASRGLGSSGALGAGAGDIYNTAGENLASAYQDWRSQGVQEMRGALAPYIENKLAQDLMHFQTGELDIRDKNAMEVYLDKVLGKDRDPSKGTLPMETLYSLMLKGTPDETTKRLLSAAFEGEFDGNSSTTGGSLSDQVEARDKASTDAILAAGLPPNVVNWAKQDPQSQYGDYVRQWCDKNGIPYPSWLR